LGLLTAVGASTPEQERIAIDGNRHVITGDYPNPLLTKQLEQAQRIDESTRIRSRHSIPGTGPIEQASQPTNIQLNQIIRRGYD
jgi:hypothetical protein